MRLLLIAAVASCTVASALAQSSWTTMVAGRYEGQVTSDGQPLPASTDLSVGSNNAISGSYTFVEPGNVRVGGSLDACAAGRSLVLTCKWRDRYGDGTLEMTFAGDFRSFSGRWSGSDKPSQWYAWSGARTK
jgi:hypothetical protein